MFFLLFLLVPCSFDILPGTNVQKLGQGEDFLKSQPLHTSVSFPYPAGYVILPDSQYPRVSSIAYP